MDDRERDELVRDLLSALEERGSPGGTWLVDIARVRQALRAADELLLGLEEAIIRDVTDQHPPEQ